jgi:hypothetical protein
MKLLSSIFSLFLLATVLMFASCSEDDPVQMSLSFLSGNQWVSSDTTLQYQDTVQVSFAAVSNGSDPLTMFELRGNGITVLDSAFSLPSFGLTTFLIKGIPAMDTWTFVIQDAAGHRDSLEIRFSRNTGIESVNSVVLGAQNNTTLPSFYSVSEKQTYFQLEAFDHQEKIDLFCFYENTVSHQNFMTLAAPGSNITGIFTGPTSPENYTVKNITYFVKTTLTPALFDAISSDEEIIPLFDPAQQFKKAKILLVNDVYAFKLSNGKFGIFKIIAVDGVEDGNLTFAYKAQQ